MWTKAAIVLATVSGAMFVFDSEHALTVLQVAGFTFLLGRVLDFVI